MKIERLLEIGKHVKIDKDIIKAIIFNRITYYIEDDGEAVISGKNFSLLADDILKWYESKIAPHDKLLQVTEDKY